MASSIFSSVPPECNLQERDTSLKSGPCDYLLLVNRRPVGVIEAFRSG